MGEGFELGVESEDFVLDPESGNQGLGVVLFEGQDLVGGGPAEVEAVLLVLEFFFLHGHQFVGHFQAQPGFIEFLTEIPEGRFTLESESTFRDLSQKFNEARLRLKMADELVAMQKEKLEYEKYRFNLGRTTTYQVLTFEQDYAQSLISRLRIENEILALHAQLKTFTQD